MVEIKGRIVENELIAPYTSFGIGGNARWMAFPRDTEDILALFDWANRVGIQVFVGGRGTNVLFPDEGFCGVVVWLRQGLSLIHI